MPSARFPFLKDPPPKSAALPLAIVDTARHNVYSPFADPGAPKRLALGKRPLSITFPWFTEINKAVEETSKSFMEQVLAEYREANPDANKPTTVDLIRWYRQRALDAEMHADGLDREVNRLEESHVRLEKEVIQMAADLRIQSASHGI